MSRITDKFSRDRAENRKGFIPFITAGHPDLETTLEIMLRLAEVDPAVIELGVPFTDPMADGPIIQLSSQKALANGGVTLRRILDLVSRFRKRSEIPVLLFGYLNPFLQFGIRNLGQAASDAGVDGFLIADVAGDEFAAISEDFAAFGIDLITLVAPTTNDHRLRQITQNARGFIYAISRAGVTGTREDLSGQAKHLVERTRKTTDLPVAVGFGISTAEHITEVWRYADAAVVGSAIVSVVEKSERGSEAGNVGEFVKNLLTGH